MVGNSNDFSSIVNFLAKILPATQRTHSENSAPFRPVESPTMSSQQLLFVRDSQGTKKVLGPLLANGGEGEIYPLQEKPDVLVKWYHDDCLQKGGKELREKIRVMIELRDVFREKSLAWPRSNVFDDGQNWIGYGMKRVSGVKMHLLAHTLLYKKHFPNLNRRIVVDYLINLAELVADLHARNIMIGDYNLNNIFCDPSNNKVYLIDCDSFQIEHGGVTYPCPVGSPDMTPIEQHGKSFRDIIRTPSSEVFSLAIVFFKCLMLGRHPYDIVGGDDPVQNLKNGKFAYGKGNQGIPHGHWYNIWSHMPYKLKDMFITTFTEGAPNPSRRPSLAQWKQVLTLYRSEIDKGWHAIDMIPANPKAKDYRGNQTK